MFWHGLADCLLFYFFVVINIDYMCAANFIVIACCKCHVTNFLLDLDETH